MYVSKVERSKDDLDPSICSKDMLRWMMDLDRSSFEFVGALVSVLCLYSVDVKRCPDSHVSLTKSTVLLV
ncbi:hypothetical protein Hanom_Chr10g00957841 [Helianthus anomalus]